MRALQCLTLVAVVLVATALLGGSALAGDYHAGTQLVCADCHTMHYSITHTYTDATAPPVGTLSGGPNPLLLKQPANTLCLSCHDGTTTAPDVLGNNTGTAYIRHAGALNNLTGNDAGYDTYMGHTLGSIATAPGSNPAWSDTAGLTCVDCHSAHNSVTSNTDVAGHTLVNAWRNVSRRAGNSTGNTRVISYETGTNTGAFDVFETDPALGQISTHYDISNMSLNEPVTTNSGVADWCMRCHTDFHGNSTSANMNNGTDWLRHPTADADFGATMSTRYDAKTNHVPVMGTGDTRTPTCLTCHKAHGNKNPFGLIYMSGSGTASEEGDSSSTGMRDLCKQCHSQGG